MPKQKRQKESYRKQLEFKTYGEISPLETDENNAYNPQASVEGRPSDIIQQYKKLDKIKDKINKKISFIRASVNTQNESEVSSPNFVEPV